MTWTIEILKDFATGVALAAAGAFVCGAVCLIVRAILPLIRRIPRDWCVYAAYALFVIVGLTVLGGMFRQ